MMMKTKLLKMGAVMTISIRIASFRKSVGFYADFDNLNQFKCNAKRHLLI